MKERNKNHGRSQFQTEPDVIKNFEFLSPDEEFHIMFDLDKPFISQYERNMGMLKQILQVWHV